MVPSKVKIKPYKSNAIPVYGITTCAVTFGSSSIPVQWHISGSCEPILARDKGLQLGIIDFNAKPNILQPINMIDKSVSNDEKDPLQKVLLNCPEHFSNPLGKLRHHQVQLHVDQSVKPVVVPPRTITYHLKARAEKVIQEMLHEDVIEVHPTNQPAPWVSGAVIVPKPKTDGEIRITMDACNVNKAIQSNNLPIPRQEDICAKLAGSRVFSKLDSKCLLAA